jgi:hypothetical protein
MRLVLPRTFCILQDDNNDERNVFNLNNIIQKNIFTWIHSVDRMEPECIPKYLMDYKQRGRQYI